MTSRIRKYRNLLRRLMSLYIKFIAHRILLFVSTKYLHTRGFLRVPFKNIQQIVYSIEYIHICKLNKDTTHTHTKTHNFQIGRPSLERTRITLEGCTEKKLYKDKPHTVNINKHSN